MKISNRKSIEKAMASAECKVIATNEFGERKMIAFGDRADMEAIMAICKPECKAEIVTNRA